MTNNPNPLPQEAELREKITKIVYGDWISYKQIKEGRVAESTTEVIDQIMHLITEQTRRAEERTIIAATGGVKFNMPIRAVRTRNTAFKKYAVKYFNTKIQERRERLLQALNQPYHKAEE